jgi:hypothetical protein
MPFDLPLPRNLASSWRVKIYDNERLEPPHVTVVKGRESWRINLRTREFMDDTPPPKQIDKDVCRPSRTIGDGCSRNGTKYTRTIRW